jgi:hypothetical protein
VAGGQLTVFPLLVVIAAASAASQQGVAVWVVYGMGLTGSFRGERAGGVREGLGASGRAVAQGLASGGVLVVFIAYIYTAATVGSVTRHAPAETVSRVSVAVVLGVARPAVRALVP